MNVFPRSQTIHFHPVKLVDRIPLGELRPALWNPVYPYPDYLQKLYQTSPRTTQPDPVCFSNLQGSFMGLLRDRHAVAVDYGFSNVITTLDTGGFWAIQPNARPYLQVRGVLETALHHLGLIYTQHGGNSPLPEDPTALWALFGDLPEAHVWIQTVAVAQDHRAQIRLAMIEAHVEWLLQYELIILEQLNLERFRRNPKKWFGVVDSGWEPSRTLLAHEAARKGVEVLEVPSHFSSATCPVCSNSHYSNRPKSTQDFRCNRCGFAHHADLVACINLLRRAGQSRSAA